ncbi:MAG: hypothetical protein ACRDJP_09340 [Actinomycetota bacterium]
MAAFERFAGGLAYGVAIGGIAYSIAFVVALKAPSDEALAVSWALLLIGGLLATGVVVAIYLRAREADPGPAMIGLLFAAVGLLGSAIHGGYELAFEFNPAERIDVALPSQIDPRGLLTFGFTGLGVLVLSRSIRTAAAFPARVAGLGSVLGIGLLLTYLGRLIILDPNNVALLGVAAITGLIVHPLWFLMIGRDLRRGPAG